MLGISFDELQFLRVRYQQHIHLLKPFMGHNRSAHAHNLRLCMKCCHSGEKSPVELLESALHLAE